MQRVKNYTTEVSLRLRIVCQKNNTVCVGEKNTQSGQIAAPAGSRPVRPHHLVHLSPVFLKA